MPCKILDQKYRRLGSDQGVSDRPPEHRIALLLCRCKSFDTLKARRRMHETTMPTQSYEPVRTGGPDTMLLSR